eukprot:1128635-Ditylum_brightwellii.AAC.1
MLSLTALPNGEINDLHPLALIAGTNANPNILNHREAMKADDKEQFLSAMEEEIERMIEKGIFKIVPRSQVSIYQKVKSTTKGHKYVQMVAYKQQALATMKHIHQ